MNFLACLNRFSLQEKVIRDLVDIIDTVTLFDVDDLAGVLLVTYHTHVLFKIHVNLTKILWARFFPGGGASFLLTLVNVQLF